MGVACLIFNILCYLCLGHIVRNISVNGIDHFNNLLMVLYLNCYKIKLFVCKEIYKKKVSNSTYATI